MITFYLGHLIPLLLTGCGCSLVSLPVDQWCRPRMLGVFSMQAVAGEVRGSCCKEVVWARWQREMVGHPFLKVL